MKKKPKLPPLFLAIIDNDAKLAKTRGGKVIKFGDAVKQIKEKRQLLRYARNIYECARPERNDKK